MSCYLFCKDMFGRTIEICLNSEEEMKNMTVIELKRRIEPGNEEELRLIFKGRQLEDGCTLGTYGMQNESTLHVVNRLRGGGLPPEDEDKQMPRTASMEILAPMQTEPESNGSCWIL